MPDLTHRAGGEWRLPTIRQPPVSSLRLLVWKEMVQAEPQSNTFSLNHLLKWLPLHQMKVSYLVRSLGLNKCS